MGRGQEVNRERKIPTALTPTPRRGDLDLSAQAPCHSDASQASPPLSCSPPQVSRSLFPSSYLFPVTSPDPRSHTIWPPVFLLPPAEFANLSHLYHLPLSSAPTVAASSWEPLTPRDLAEVVSVCQGPPVWPVEPGLCFCPVVTVRMQPVGHRAGVGRSWPRTWSSTSTCRPRVALSPGRSCLRLC